MGVSNHWTGIWTGMVEWTVEYGMDYRTCVQQTTISHCVLASLVPFHSVSPQNCR